MIILNCLGDWLVESGWTTALPSSRVTISGNESLGTRHNVVNTKYTHQVTIKSLHLLRKGTFNNYVYESSNQAIFGE